MVTVKKKVPKSSSVSKRKSKVRIVHSSPRVKSPQEEIKSRQQDGLEIYSVLGANLDERDFFERWDRLGKTPSPSELEGLDKERIKEIELSRKKEAEIKEKIGSVCFRLRFVETLQHDNRFTEIYESFQSEALQIYLLCTCFDTLAGQSSHKRFDEWVSEKEDVDLLQTTPSATSNHELVAWYKQTTKRLFDKHLDDHGVSRNFRKLFNDLPDVLQNELVDSFAVVRENESNESWVKTPRDKQLRRIVDYLFARRNRYTHKSEVEPTSHSDIGIKGWVCFHFAEIDNKIYKICIANADEVRNERSLLIFILVGILRTLLGYQIDEQFPKLYWFIEKNIAQFRNILNELRRNYSLRSWYLSNQPVDLAKTPSSYRLYYFRTDSIDALLGNEKINLEWFFGMPATTLDADIRKNLRSYKKQVQNFNKLLNKYESQSRKPKAQDKTKIAAYERFCQRLKDVDLNIFTENIMGDFYYLLSNAPQIPANVYLGN